MNNTPNLILSSYLPYIPILLVWLAGIIIALRHWKRHPRVSLVALIALSLFILRALADPLLTFGVIRQIENKDHLHLAYNLYSILAGLWSSILWALLLVTVFGWRRGNTVAEG